MVGTQRFITTGCNSAPGRIPRLILGLERLTDLGGRFFANGAHSTAHERAQLHCSSVWSMHSPKRTYTAAAHAGPVIADEDASRHFRRAPRVTLLQQFGRDLTQQVQHGQLDPVIGRDAVITRVSHILLRRTKNNPLLLGDPGVGKTAIAEGIAHLMARSKEVENSRGNVMLFIDEIHTLIGAGAVEGALDAANILKPALARGTLHCIGATTHEEYEKHMQSDPALSRRFQVVNVPEPSQDEALAVLMGLQPLYERHHSVKFAPGALRSAVACAAQYGRGKLPDSAIDVMDEAAALCSAHDLEASRTSQPFTGNATPQPPQHRPMAGSLPVPGAFEAVPKYSQRGMACPHCGLAAENAESSGRSSLICKACFTEFLNIPSDRLMLGSSVLQAAPKTRSPRNKPSTVMSQDSFTSPAAAATGSPAGSAQWLASGGAGGVQQTSQSMASMHDNTFARGAVVDHDVILQVVAEQSGVPVGHLRGDKEWFGHLYDVLDSRVVGQEPAKQAMIHAAKLAHTKSLESRHRMHATHVSRTHREAPSVFLKGPEGSGKATICRTLSGALFPPSGVLWLDMTQFSSTAGVVQLVGPPAGTVGHSEGGILTRLLRRHRHCLVVAQNIEAAHSSVQRLLASMLQQGSLRDGHRELSCRHMWLVATSHVSTGVAEGSGSEGSGSDTQKGHGSPKQHQEGGSGSMGGESNCQGSAAAQQKRLQQQENGPGSAMGAAGADQVQNLQPELLGMLQNVQLKPLTTSERCRMARSRLQELSERLWAAHGMPLSWTNAAVRHLAAGHTTCAASGVAESLDVYSSPSTSETHRKSVMDSPTDDLAAGNTTCAASGVADTDTNSKSIMETNFEVSRAPENQQKNAFNVQNQNTKFSGSGHDVNRAVEALQACCWQIVAGRAKYETSSSSSTEYTVHADVVDGVLMCGVERHAAAQAAQ